MPTSASTAALQRTKRTKASTLLFCVALRFFAAIPFFVWFGYFVVAN